MDIGLIILGIRRDMQYVGLGGCRNKALFWGVFPSRMKLLGGSIFRPIYGHLHMLMSEHEMETTVQYYCSFTAHDEKPDEPVCLNP